MSQPGLGRPLGVTVIAILTVTVGIMSVFAGISLILFGAIISNISMGTPSSYPLIGSIFGVLSAGLGAILLIIGIGYIIMSYGLLKGKGWASTITIILSLIGIAINIVSAITASVYDISAVNTMSSNPSSIISGITGSAIVIVINIVIIYYLYRTHVKVFFGKATTRENPKL